jgi:hypothetical protein
MKPPMQERYQVYVLGPTQDGRLASIAPGQFVRKINLHLDSDAPFILRSRALRQKFVSEVFGEGGTQAGLQFLKTQWTGPQQDYRQSDFIPESLQQPYYGYNGNPTPVSPEIPYPPNGTITIDVQNTGAAAITNLTFYWIGVNLYPWGMLPSPSYPAKFSGLTFAQPFIIPALAAPEIRLNQPFTVKPDGDFAIRGGQAAEIPATGATTGVLQAASEMFIVLRDYNGMPYSNDWVDLNIMFGQDNFLSAFPVGPVPSFVQPFGTGSRAPGLIYPEIYVPQDRQLLIDVNHACGGGWPVSEDLLINFIGAKVFKAV